MDTKTNRELFESLGIIDTTWRKWSRVFLEPDPAAGQRKGRTRTYTAEEAFRVWAGGKMLTDHVMTYKEAAAALDALIAFMGQQNYFPLTRANINRDDGVREWTFTVTRTPDAVMFHAKGMIDEFPIELADDGSYEIVTEKYKKQAVGGDFGGKGICSVNIPIEAWIDEFLTVTGFPG